jgi:hypothetical protein
MSPFSSQIREEILATFPEWEPFVTSETYKGSQSYMVVTVPPPLEAKAEHPLRISTWDEEVTIDFDYYHTHFDRWNPEEGDDRTKSALLYTKAVLEEQIAVASWWQGDHCKLCSQIESGASLKPPFRVAYTRFC